MVDGLTIKTDKCCGCRSCEMVCSFHHLGVFQPSASSIEINEQDGGKMCSVTIHKTRLGTHLACDKCAGLEVPLCVKICSDTMSNELNSILAHIPG